jgi:phage terminase small subunit
MKGRAPNPSNVVPLTGGSGFDDTRFDEAARAKAAVLKACTLAPSVEASAVWDDLAWLIAHPRCARLSQHNAQSFMLGCDAFARYRALRSEYSGAEFYETETRNGTQFKAHPAVAQMNETWRQWLTVARDFGLTPAGERSLAKPDFNPGDDTDQLFT